MFFFQGDKVGRKVEMRCPDCAEANLQKVFCCEGCTSSLLQVRERSPSSTLLQLLAHSPALTAEWFVGSSNGTRYVPRDESAIGPSQPEDASETHI